MHSTAVGQKVIDIPPGMSMSTPPWQHTREARGQIRRLEAWLAAERPKVAWSARQEWTDSGGNRVRDRCQPGGGVLDDSLTKVPQPGTTRTSPASDSSDTALRAVFLATP